MTWLTVGSRNSLVRGLFLQSDANNTETVLFTMFFAFVLYGHKAECNMNWPIGQEVNRYTLWTSCTGVSLKRPFLSTMRSLGDSWLTEMRILVGRVLHIGTERTLKMSYLVCFCFLSARDLR